MDWLHGLDGVVAAWRAHRNADVEPVVMGSTILTQNGQKHVPGCPSTSRSICFLMGSLRAPACSRTEANPHTLAHVI
jgi:hypothetical protein